MRKANVKSTTSSLFTCLRESDHAEDESAPTRRHVNSCRVPKTPDRIQMADMEQCNAGTRGANPAHTRGADAAPQPSGGAAASALSLKAFHDRLSFISARLENHQVQPAHVTRPGVVFVGCADDTVRGWVLRGVDNVECVHDKPSSERVAVLTAAGQAREWVCAGSDDGMVRIFHTGGGGFLSPLQPCPLLHII
jgi:hypothetical protein